ncbi:MAG TPA: hypothetical protein VLD63_00550 [Anaerolineales bacterium]|nr:hypothetical protein [Anaerolineales bacterium]
MGLPGGVFRRVQGGGWLVLAGSIPEFDEAVGWIDLLLARAIASRPVVWLETEPGAVEPGEFLNDIEEQVEAPVQSIPIDHPEWEGAGLLMVSEAADPARLARSEASPRLLACLQSGAAVAAFGRTAGAFGGVILVEGGLAPGMAWLSDSIILPESMTAPAAEPLVRDYLRSPEKRLGLRLPPLSVLALGPQGEVEVWGGPQPGLILGSAWSHV